mmetsp:Transcript_164155/g.522012  ORF Transcript_164155/g.522012 Transcript_164155/m.522012 type:complete len:125 (-) Transcript_164155:919-1293(-)
MDAIPTSFGDADGDDNGMHVPAAPQCTRVLDQNALAGLDSYEEEYIATASNTNISVQVGTSDAPWQQPTSRQRPHSVLLGHSRVPAVGCRCLADGRPQQQPRRLHALAHGPAADSTEECIGERD